ncbi:MAG: SIS domain-containing protein [Pseudomonadota bacterium]
MSERVKRLFDAHADVIAASCAVAADIEAAIALCETALSAGNKILLCGNGGSAADAQHIATELTVRFQRDRPALAAIALTTDTSALTAAANDLGVEHMFSRQVAGLAGPGDVLIALSTSGQSPNVLKAMETARDRGVSCLLLSGRDGGHARALADIAIIVPSDVTARIQEVHILIGHILCEALDELGS